MIEPLCADSSKSTEASFAFDFFGKDSSWISSGEVVRLRGRPIDDSPLLSAMFGLALLGESEKTELRIEEAGYPG